ncbi:MAG: histone deacetylase [Candidatus Hydrothermarchaeota archaeon]
MAKTGVFYHKIFKKIRRIRNFPEILEQLLKKPNVILYECEPVSTDLLLRIHSNEMIESIKRKKIYENALYSAGGAAKAAEKVFKREIDNAFVFVGVGGHHAGKNSYGGLCYFNDVALAIENLRIKFNLKRFVIFDTDSHHGDGTRVIFEQDSNILHICLCDRDEVSLDGTKVDVKIPEYFTSDYFGYSNEEYLRIVKREFIPRALRFEPEMIFWYFGYDTYIYDYGDIGLTYPCYLKLTEIIKSVSEKICHGRLVVVLGGGSSIGVANLVIPMVIGCLAR